MKYIKSLICFILCGFLLAGCVPQGVEDFLNDAKDAVVPIKLSGELKEVTFTPADGIPATKLDFEKISFTSGDAKINIIPSNETKVVAVYQADIEKHGFAINMRDGEIWVSVPKQSNFATEKFALNVYANINEIEVSGGVEMDIDAKGISALDIDIEGASKIYLHGANAAKLSVEVKGAATMDIAGTAENLEAEIKGAGKIEAKSLVTKFAEIKISGAGTASISVTKLLTADIDGVGTLDYYGDPQVKNLSSGLANVEQVSKTIYGE